MRSLATIAIVALTACAAPATTAPTKTTSATSSATHTTADVAYLTGIRGTVQGATDADLINAGHHACDLYGQGLTALGVTSQLVDDGYTTQAAATITITSAAVYCQQFKE